jgi:hypothetical protein
VWWKLETGHVLSYPNGEHTDKLRVRQSCKPGGYERPKVRRSGVLRIEIEIAVSTHLTLVLDIHDTLT